MGGRGEAKKVKYRCRYCQKEYMSREEFIEHKKSKHGEEMSLEVESRDGKKRPAPSTSLPRGQVTPSQLSSPPVSAPGIPSTSGSSSLETGAQIGRQDEEDAKSEEQEGTRPSGEPSDVSSPVQKRSRKSGVEKESNVTKPKAANKRSKKRLQSKPEARAGLRPRRDGKRLGTTQTTTRKNMPMPYGQKVRTVGLDGKEKEEWLRNPKMKGA